MRTIPGDDILPVPGDLDRSYVGYAQHCAPVRMRVGIRRGERAQPPSPTLPLILVHPSFSQCSWTMNAALKKRRAGRRPASARARRYFRTGEVVHRF